MSLKLDLERPVSEFLVRQPITLEEGDTVEAAAKKMARNGVGAIIVTRRGEPVGVITERDILNRVVAAEKSAGRTLVSEVMSSPLKTVDYSAKVGDAILLMRKAGVRRLGVVKDGKLLGLVSQRGLVGAGTSGQVALPELESPRGLRCPYCSQEMPDAKQLSKHIDQVHIGKGLLEGDTSRW